MEAVTSGACNINNKELLHLDLKEKLSGKKFLIVLDDVWTEDCDGWNSLIRPLQSGTKGSKILVTTRIENVASMVQTFQTYHLEQLSEEDCCWSVFANFACLSPKKSVENMELHKIGKEIVRKCKGLPLVAQSLGGLLRRKHDIKDWNNILNSNIWENESKIIPAPRISYHYLPSYLSNLKCLRVLSFRWFSNLDALPDSIGELIHLRYLDFSCTSITTLPESLCNLNNLQTLKLCYCEELTKLPNDMQNLVNLRRLYIRQCHMLEEMPREMSKLKNLQHLSVFLVGKHGEKGIKDVGTLSNLQGSLSITKLENVINSSEASEAKIVDKKYLEKLSLSWSEDEKDLHFTNSQSEMDILGKLQPTKNPKRLDVHRYRGTRFPEWVGNSSYHNLTELYLIDCRNCCILPPLCQLSSLEKLTMRRMSMLETIGYEYGDSFSGTLFPSLECLEFKDMPSWNMWHHSHESEGSYPVLKSLEILDCPKLEGGLPSHLPNMEKIKIQRCNQLGSSLPKAFAIRKLYIFESNIK